MHIQADSAPVGRGAQSATAGHDDIDQTAVADLAAECRRHTADGVRCFQHQILGIERGRWVDLGDAAVARNQAGRTRLVVDGAAQQQAVGHTHINLAAATGDEVDGNGVVGTHGAGDPYRAVGRKFVAIPGFVAVLVLALDTVRIDMPAVGRCWKVKVALAPLHEITTIADSCLSLSEHSAIHLPGEIRARGKAAVTVGAFTGPTLAGRHAGIRIAGRHIVPITGDTGTEVDVAPDISRAPPLVNLVRLRVVGRGTAGIAAGPLCILIGPAGTIGHALAVVQGKLGAIRTGDIPRHVVECRVARTLVLVRDLDNAVLATGHVHGAQLHVHTCVQRLHRNIAEAAGHLDGTTVGGADDLSVQVYLATA